MPSDSDFSPASILFCPVSDTASGADWTWVTEAIVRSGPLPALSHADAEDTANENSHPREEIIAVVPAEMTLSVAVAVPSSKLQHIRAAVPHLIDEWTADELEKLHIAMGERDAGGQVAVAILRRELLAGWMEAIADASLICRRTFVDALLLPRQADAVTLLLSRGRALVRWHEYRAGALPCDQLPLLLEQISASAEPRCCNLLLAADCAAEEAAFVEHLLESAGIAVDRSQLAEPAHVYLARRARQSGALNLLQGDFAAADAAAPAWRRWRPAIGFAVFFIALNALLGFIGGGILLYRAHATHGEAERLYRELFPQDRKLVNLRLQMQNHLDDGRYGGRSPFLGLMSRFSSGVQSMAADQRPQLRGFIFDSGSGIAQVEMIAQSLQAVDDLQKHLGRQRLRVRVLSVANDGGATIARLSLQGE